MDMIENTTDNVVIIFGLRPALCAYGAMISTKIYRKLSIGFSIDSSILRII